MNPPSEPAAAKVRDLVQVRRALILLHDELLEQGALTRQLEREFRLAMSEATDGNLTGGVEYGCDSGGTSDRAAASSERLEAREGRPRTDASTSPQRGLEPSRDRGGKGHKAGRPVVTGPTGHETPAPPLTSAAINLDDPAGLAWIRDGLVLDGANLDLVRDLNRGLAWARALLSEMGTDKRLPLRWREQIELFLEDEGNQTELEWMTEPEDE